MWTLNRLRLPDPPRRLRIPVIDTAAKKALGYANEPIAQFIDECLIYDASGKVAKAEVYDAFQEWGDDDCKSINNRAFGKRLINLSNHRIKAVSNIKVEYDAVAATYTSVLS